MNPMVYALLQAHISEHISFQAHGEIGAFVAEDPQMLQMKQQDPDGYLVQFNSLVSKRIAEMTANLVAQEGGSQDPLVALKQRELDLKAMDIQRRAQESMLDLERKEFEFDEKLDVEKMKLEQQQDQSDDRLAVAKEKLEVAREKANVKKD